MYSNILSKYSLGTVHIQLFLKVIRSILDSMLEATKNSISCDFHQSGLRNFSSKLRKTSLAGEELGIILLCSRLKHYAILHEE